MTEAQQVQQSHDTDGTKIFFDQWHVYKQVIRGDYMRHRDIHTALHQAMARWHKSPFSVLDLGCGDASLIAQTLQGLPVRAYTGVDVSSGALQNAEEHLVSADFRVTLIEADFADYLSRDDGPKVDVVVAGYSVHHLTAAEKPGFFRTCFSALNVPGDLFLYDIFRRHGESRAQFLKAYFARCHRNWRALAYDQLDMAKQHASACDLPEAYDDLTQMARSAGFAAPSAPIFADRDGFHYLCHLHRRRTTGSLRNGLSAAPRTVTHGES